MATSPGWSLNYDPPAAEWNYWWSSKVDQANPILTGPLVPFSWTTATRPTSPVLSATGWNTTIGALESWNGSAWVTAFGGPPISLAMQPVVASATTAAAFELLQRYNVKAYGATGNGSTDDTTAIQAAIAACGAAGGGVVYFPSGNYLISSTLAIGNGTSSAASTINGVILQGEGQPNVPGMFAGMAITCPTRITWGGGASAMISINGPLQGWGVQNLLLDGVTTATAGLSIMSAQFGDCRNLAIKNCTTEHIGSNTYALFGSLGNTDSLHNHFQNIYIQMPAVANVKGVVLTGDVATNSDTDANVFDNMIIGLPGTLTTYGIYLQNCDGNQFRNVLLAGGCASSIGVLFDYTASTGSVFPSGACFYGIDTSGFTLGANQWVNAGTPGVTARPHTLRGLYQDNGATQPNLANFIPDVPAVFAPSLQLTGQTTSISAATLVTTFEAGIYRISGYLAETATGNSVTVLATISWYDPSGAQRTFATSAINLSSGTNNPQPFSVTVACIANEPIGYSTTVSGAVGSGTYCLALVAERLS